MESTENGNFCGHAIISHKEDLDGIIAATLLTYVLDKSKNFPNPEKKYGKNGRKETPSKIKKGHLSDHNNKSCLYLIGYPGFPGLIEKLRKGGRQVSLIIADLGMSPDTIEVLHKFVKNMGAEKSTRCQHYYFDHHILPDGGETTIRAKKIRRRKIC